MIIYQFLNNIVGLHNKDQSSYNAVLRMVNSVVDIGFFD